MSKRISFLLSALIIFLFIITGVAFGGTIDPSKEKVITSKLGVLQIPFIKNESQIKDPSVKYYANTFAGTVFVTDKGEIVYSLRSKDNNKESANHNIPPLAKGGEGGFNSQKPEDVAAGFSLRDSELLTQNSELIKSWVIKEKILGIKSTTVQGMDKAETKVNYFIGNKKEDWRSNISSYNSVSLGEVYDGIELKLKAYGNNVEKLFYVKPDANPEEIRLKLEGAKGIKVNEKGELEETELVSCQLNIFTVLSFRAKRGIS